MTLKYTKLQEFAKHLKFKYIDQVSTQSLRQDVAEYFDAVSDYSISTVIKKLVEFKFLSEKAIGIWKISSGLIDEKEAEEHEEQKIDDMIGGASEPKEGKG